jgi:hypothetical protein
MTKTCVDRLEVLTKIEVGQQYSEEDSASCPLLARTTWPSSELTSKIYQKIVGVSLEINKEPRQRTEIAIRFARPQENITLP